MIARQARLHSITFVALLVCITSVCRAAEPALSVTVLYSDAGTDTTHFRTDFIPWLEGGAISESTGVGSKRTELLPASSIGYLRLPEGLRSDWHPAPLKQYVMVLTGKMEVEAGDGERKTFTAGSVLLVTDVQGRGHRTNVVGNRDVLLVWVPIP